MLGAERGGLFRSHLKQLDEIVLAERLERRAGSAYLGANARNLAAEEQTRPGRRAELPNTPRASGIIRDASHDNASQHLVVSVSSTYSARWCPHPKPRRSGWQHDVHLEVSNGGEST